jgi:ribosomal protein L37AE/L43A
MEGVVAQGGSKMTLHSETRARLVTSSKNSCPQCSEWLLAPDWSEYLNDRCVRHTWSCEACGYQFETAVYFPAIAKSRAA